MKTFTTLSLRLGVPLSLALGLATACQEHVGPSPEAESQVAIEVSPLTLSGVGDATWRISVHNGATPPELVWSHEVGSQQFGDGAGGVAYVGPCDASPGNRLNTVSLELLALYDDLGAVIPPEDYQNPTSPTPLSVTVECQENADVPVQFNVTVMRRAEQGFLDVTVGFDNVFCSAKMDCADEFLLYPHDDPQGRTGRGPTAVIAFACTTGSDAAGDPRPTHMYLNEVKMVCPRHPPEDDVTVWVLSGDGPGNLGPRPPLLYQSAVYYGKEGFTDINKCYWNLALGVELDAITDAGPCRVTVTGTASPEPFEYNQVAAGQAWPVVTWDVTLDLDDGALACGLNPLDGQDSGVVTDYTSPDSAAFFTYGLSCEGDEPTIETADACGVPFEGQNFFFTRSAEGILVSWGGVSAPSPYTLPDPSWRLAAFGDPGSGAACCADGCCP